MNTKEIKAWMTTNLVDHIDECREVNTTSLAEAAADVFDLYEDKVNYVIPVEVFDLAVDVEDENLCDDCGCATAVKHTCPECENDVCDFCLANHESGGC